MLEPLFRITPPRMWKAKMFVKTIPYPFPGVPCRRKSNLKQNEPTSNWFKWSCRSQLAGCCGLVQEAKPGGPPAVDAELPPPPPGVPPARPSRPRWGLPTARCLWDLPTLRIQGRCPTCLGWPEMRTLGPAPSGVWWHRRLCRDPPQHDGGRGLKVTPVSAGPGWVSPGR